MADDHLSNEVSLSVELTERGLKVGTVSRAVSSVERLLGGVFDLANVQLERIAQKGRAKTAAEVSVIQALGKMQLEAIQSDPDFAARAMQQHLKVAGIRYENKAASVAAALEDLRETPSTEENASDGDVLSDAFINRWERYAEEATDDQIREKWGRVLASEIRKPGTFSAKVLRVVDELDATTALTFERLCASRVGDTIVRGLAGKLNFDESASLVAADLIAEPTLGQVRLPTSGTAGDGAPLTLLFLDGSAVALSAEIASAKFGHDNDAAIMEHNNGPVMPIYSLTDAGKAISSILPNDSRKNLRRLIEVVSQQIGGLEVRGYVTREGGGLYLDATASSGRLVLNSL